MASQVMVQATAMNPKIDKTMMLARFMVNRKEMVVKGLAIEGKQQHLTEGRC